MSGEQKDQGTGLEREMPNYWDDRVRGTCAVPSPSPLETHITPNCGRGSTGWLAARESRFKSMAVRGSAQKGSLKNFPSHMVPGEGKLTAMWLFCLYMVLVFTH